MKAHLDWLRDRVVFTAQARRDRAQSRFHIGDPGVWVNADIQPAQRRGVVIVHGVGGSKKSDMLLDVAEPIVEWLNNWYHTNDSQLPRGPGEYSPRSDLRPVLSFAPTDVGSDDRPATVSIALPCEASESDREWLMSEAWWASSVRHASFPSVLDWIGENLLTLYGYAFFVALGRNPFLAPPEPELDETLFVRIVEILNGLVLFAALFVAFVPGLITLVLLQLLMAVPLPPLQALLATIQPYFVINFGEFRLYIEDEVLAANMRRRVFEAAEVISPYCDAITIVAYSEGVLAAHGLLSDPVYTNDPACRAVLKKVKKLVTVGSALNKSWQFRPNLERLRRPIMEHIYWVNIWGTYDIVSTGWLQPPHWDSKDHKWRVGGHERWVYNGEGQWAQVFNPSESVQSLPGVKKQAQARPDEAGVQARERDYEFVARNGSVLWIPIVVSAAVVIRLLDPPDWIRPLWSSLPASITTPLGFPLGFWAVGVLGLASIWTVVSAMTVQLVHHGRSHQQWGPALWTCFACVVLSILVLANLDGDGGVPTQWLMWLPASGALLALWGPNRWDPFAWVRWLLGLLGIAMTATLGWDVQPIVRASFQLVSLVAPQSGEAVPARWLTAVPLAIGGFLVAYWITHRGVTKNPQPRPEREIWWPCSVAVHNEMHPLFDHLTYWNNDEAVIGRLVAEIDSTDPSKSGFWRALVAPIVPLQKKVNRKEGLQTTGIRERSVRVAQLTATWAALNILALVWIIPPMPGAAWTSPGGWLRTLLRTVFDALPLFGVKVAGVQSWLHGLGVIGGVTLDEFVARGATSAGWFLIVLIVYQSFVRGSWGERDEAARARSVRRIGAEAVRTSSAQIKQSPMVIVGGSGKATRTAPQQAPPAKHV